MTISQIMLRWLLLIMIIAFVASVTVLWLFQTQLSFISTKKVLKQNLADVCQDISDMSDANLKNAAMEVGYYYDNDSVTPDDEYLLRYAESRGIEKIDDSVILSYLCDAVDLGEIDVIDENGIIIASTEKKFIGFDMASGEQSAAFLPLLDGETELIVQPYGPISADNSILRKYAGVALENKKGFLQVAYDAEHFQEDISEDVVNITKNRHVGATGCIIIIDEDYTVVSGNHAYDGRNLRDSGIKVGEKRRAEGELFKTVVYGEKSNCMYVENEGYYIIAVMPCREVNRVRNISVAVTAGIEFIIYFILYFGLFRMIKHQVVDHLEEVTESLDAITDGDLDVVLDVRGNREFVTLSKDINETVDSLKDLMEAEAKRIEQELEYARNIQVSALPSVFPPYPDYVDKFDIFAKMRPAKEVGGDFYDFFLTGNGRLAFVVADVSGKGIPAAMFMMRAKALIKSSAADSTDPGEILRKVNNALCEGNTAGMFVTAWFGILDPETGVLEYANAGHNLPLLRCGGEQYEYLKTGANFILAGMENIRYGTKTLQLGHGDEIFIYTDGVTEATNADIELYGDDRLRTALNENPQGITSEEICASIGKSVDEFVGKAPQFDDITMLSLRFM